MDGRTVQNAAHSAERSGTARTMARAGYAMLGVLHVIIGVIAIVVASSGGGEADQSGAMRGIASAPLGFIALWLIALGLLALGVWQVVETVSVPEFDAKKKWGKRVSEGGKGISYFVLGISALIFALGGNTNAKQSSQSLSGRLMSAPGGVFLVVLIGLVIVGIAVGFIVRGATRRFTRDIRVPDGPAGRGVVIAGVVGYLAKGIALGVVGVLFCVAAATFDPSKASGLDGALKSLAHLPFGVVLLYMVGVGLIAYGLYCMARAPLARL